MAPSPKSLILDLLSTLRRGAMPVRALVEAGALFDVEPGSLRVALARLLARGLVERDERGRYRLGSTAAAVAGTVAGWRRLEAQVRPWDGGWIGVHVPPAPARRRAGDPSLGLRLLGFRALEPGLLVRPDNLAGGSARVRERLEGLGVPEGAVVFALRDLDPETDTRARRLWDAEPLRAGYRETRAALLASARRLRRLPPERAMVESFRVGGDAIRRLARDPLLPPPLVPARERAALVSAMRRYDELGRAAWSAFLAKHGVPHRHAPADFRMADAAGLEPALAAGGAS